jgi:hypothetical protein
MATKYGVDAFIEWAKIKGRRRGIKLALFGVTALVIVGLVLNEYVFV